MSNNLEVPFQDFLFYLYHSASPSPNSTREGSVARDQVAVRGNGSNLKKDILKRNHSIVERSLERIKSQSQIDVGEAERSSIMERKDPSSHSKGSRGHMGIVIHTGKSSKSRQNGHAEEENRQESSRTMTRKQDTAEKDKRQSYNDDGSRGNHAEETLQLRSSTKSQSQLSQRSVESKKTNGKGKQDRYEEDDSYLPKRVSSLSISPDNGVRTNNSSKYQGSSHTQQSQSRQEIIKEPRNGSKSRVSYRDSLGDCSVKGRDIEIRAPSPTKGIQQSTNSRSRSPSKVFQQPQQDKGIKSGGKKSTGISITDHDEIYKREDSEEDANYEINHLTVPYQADDLAFFKNFSATTGTRSKAELEKYLVQTGNRKYSTTNSTTTAVYHGAKQPKEDPKGHKEKVSKRTRSTPIAVDVMTNVKNGSSKQHHRHSSIFLPDIYGEKGQLIQYEEHAEEFDDDDDSNDDKVPIQDDTYYNNSDSGEEYERKEKVLENGRSNSRNSHFENGVGRNSGMALSTASLMPLGVNDIDVNDLGLDKRAEVTSSAINKSNMNTAVVPVSQRGRKKKDEKAGKTTKTEVRVRMDNSSVFLDTVFVNMKQDVDSAATIKLFY